MPAISLAADGNTERRALSLVLYTHKHIEWFTLAVSFWPMWLQTLRDFIILWFQRRDPSGTPSSSSLLAFLLSIFRPKTVLVHVCSWVCLRMRLLEQQRILGKEAFIFNTYGCRWRNHTGKELGSWECPEQLCTSLCISLSRPQTLLWSTEPHKGENCLFPKDFVLYSFRHEGVQVSIYFGYIA